MIRKTVHYEGSMDIRILQKRILSGEIPEETLKDYLNSLPDVSDNAEEITVSLEYKR